MDEIKARKILKDHIVVDNRLSSSMVFVSWEPGDDNIQLDGDFDIDELEAFAWWMKNKGV